MATLRTLMARVLRPTNLSGSLAAATLVCALAPSLTACVEPHCFDASDCESPQVCGADGLCAFECSSAPDCPEGFVCEGHRCAPRPVHPVVCPDEMTAVAETFCVDLYEASRPDATEQAEGSDESSARSLKGVMPWRVASNAVAEAACAAAGKRLCSAAEWELACRGPEGTVYGYGDRYEPETCNGIDAFGRSAFHLEPTGAFPDCTNGWGVFDMNGNLWEHVANGSDMLVRGGAFNCGDSATLHRCDYVPGSWVPSARGFRCCLSPSASDAGLPPDAGSTADAGTDGGGRADPDAGLPLDAGLPPDAGADGGGCIDPDAGLPPDAGPDAGSDDDGGGLEPDAGIEDSGIVDAGDEPDAGSEDAGEADAGSEDAGDEPDAGFEDAGETDAGSEDAGDESDAGFEDTGTPDGGRCPPEMAVVGGFCIDRWEASREDATESSAGVSEIPTSRPGARPWFSSSLDTATAREACARAGKRLCRSDEWFNTCGGPAGAVYSYGDAYDPVACNGIDAFCNCSSTSCSAVPACPYPHCYNQASPDGTGGPCGAGFHVMPTGSFPDCTNAFGVFDINGNVWEAVEPAVPDGLEHFRGGAYNCGDSETLHRCDYDATWSPSARGFRCCTEAR